MSQAQPVEQATCDCGSILFQIVAYISTDGTRGVGAVTLTGDGDITGWSGVFECVECLKRLELPQVVQPTKLQVITGGMAQGP